MSTYSDEDDDGLLRFPLKKTTILSSTNQEQQNNYTTMMTDSTDNQQQDMMMMMRTSSTGPTPPPNSAAAPAKKAAPPKTAKKQETTKDDVEKVFNSLIDQAISYELKTNPHTGLDDVSPGLTQEELLDRRVAEARKKKPTDAMLSRLAQLIKKRNSSSSEVRKLKVIVKMREATPESFFVHFLNPAKKLGDLAKKEIEEVKAARAESARTGEPMDRVTPLNERIAKIIEDKTENETFFKSCTTDIQKYLALQVKNVIDGATLSTSPYHEIRRQYLVNRDYNKTVITRGGAVVEGLFPTAQYVQVTTVFRSFSNFDDPWNPWLLPKSTFSFFAGDPVPQQDAKTIIEAFEAVNTIRHKKINPLSCAKAHFSPENPHQLSRRRARSTAKQPVSEASPANTRSLLLSDVLQSMQTVRVDVRLELDAEIRLGKYPTITAIHQYNSVLDQKFLLRLRMDEFLGHIVGRLTGDRSLCMRFKSLEDFRNLVELLDYHDINDDQPIDLEKDAGISLIDDDDDDDDDGDGDGDGDDNNNGDQQNEQAQTDSSQVLNVEEEEEESEEDEESDASSDDDEGLSDMLDDDEAVETAVKGSQKKKTVRKVNISSAAKPRKQRAKQPAAKKDSKKPAAKKAGKKK